MPGRRIRIKRARAWVWMYEQMFEVEEGDDEQTKHTDDDSSCDSADDDDSTGR